MSEDPQQSAKFETVATCLSPKIQRYLERMLGPSPSVDDLLQETLIRVSRGLTGFRGQSSVKTWAFAIATRVVADHFRRPEARSKIVEMDESEIAKQDPTVEDQLVIDEMNACVRGVIDSLPETYRAALVLHDLEGLTAAATADACGCTLATAKIRIHRARARLRSALESECDFYRDRGDVFRCEPRGSESLEPQDPRKPKTG